ncbi:TPA: CJH_07325 family protein [Campylobacter jejuni]|uniref:CJH_07325 family protein n=1 Tax=Campylobacter jejuni TaxID=197 RepID=UPI00069C998F|nr:CJH_07325 family protein [Campylobacter jejuni]
MEKLVRDSYGKVGYINMPYENTGSTCNIRTEQTDDVKLHDKLQNISNILDELYKDCEINEFFENKLR